MADEELSLNEDQLLDNFDDANGDGDLLISEVSVLYYQVVSCWIFMSFGFVLLVICRNKMSLECKLIRNWKRLRRV